MSADCLPPAPYWGGRQKTNGKPCSGKKRRFFPFVKALPRPYARRTHKSPGRSACPGRNKSFLRDQFFKDRKDVFGGGAVLFLRSAAHPDSARNLPAREQGIAARGQPAGISGIYSVYSTRPPVCQAPRASPPVLCPLPFPMPRYRVRQIPAPAFSRDRKFFVPLSRKRKIYYNLFTRIVWIFLQVCDTIM